MKLIAEQSHIGYETGLMTRLVFLRKLFSDREWNVNELAERAGLSRGAVSRHLNGKVDPDFATWKKYAGAFGLDIDQFDHMRKGGGGLIIVKEPLPQMELSGDDGTKLVVAEEIVREMKRQADLEGRDFLEWLEDVIRRGMKVERTGSDTGPAATGGKPEEPGMPPKRPRRPK